MNNEKIVNKTKNLAKITPNLDNQTINIDTDTNIIQLNWYNSS